MVSVLMLLTVMYMIMNQINLWNTELRNEHQARLNYTVLSLIITEWESLQSTAYMAKTPLFQVPKHMHL